MFTLMPLNERFLLTSVRVVRLRSESLSRSEASASSASLSFMSESNGLYLGFTVSLL